MELFRIFPDDAAAEKWLIEQRWPNGIACHHCGSTNVQTGAKHKTMPFRCRDCRKRFSVRTGTVMQASNLGLRVWVVAMYLMSTNLKGISSMKLHRDLDVTQKAAWFLAHRLRDAWRVDGHPGLPFLGPLEVDETHVGGKAKSMHGKRKKALGIGDNPLANKTTVVGVRDRETGKVKAAVVQDTAPETLHGFVAHCAAPTAMLYSDGEAAYAAWPRHAAVIHSAGEYVKGQASINGMESFWSLLKRGYVGTFHRMSREHLPRYVAEFEGRHNARGQDTIDQMAAMVRGADGKRLRYRDLTAHRHGHTATAI